ncbi:hypothetical protein ACQKJG_30280 [Priestia megaterium]|uniref:hypothetical protein n=1 Tax=Priestia megaterium TaxID=1404 RepID=UPI003D0325CE
MTTNNFKKISWIKNSTEYYSYINSDVVPVLTPNNTKRKSRWTKVLDFHGVKQVDNVVNNQYDELSYLTIHDLQSSKVLTENWVVLLNKDFLPAVYFFSQKTNRSLIVIDSLEELIEIISYKTPKSILIIDKYQSFTIKILKEISNSIYNKSINIRWGIATAKDIEGISFVITKFLISGNIQGSTGTLDILNKRIVNVKEGINYSTNSIKQAVNNTWENLIIAAHGEGAHANLESVVLCGLSEEIEKDLNGNYIHKGCNLEKCKRAQSKNVESMPVYQLKIKNCLFLSCNGFSVAGDLYPSDLSFVLSAAEGYVTNIITTTETQSFNPDIVEIFHYMIQNEMNMSDIVNIHNDIQKNFKNNYPFVLFGDPLAYDNSSNEVNSLEQYDELKFEIDNKVSIHRRKIKEHSSIYQINPNEIVPFIGKNYIVYLNKSNEPLKNIKLTNVLGKAEVLVENLNISLQKLAQLKLFEDQLLIINARILQKLDSQENDIFKKFSKYRKELNLCIERFFLDINRMYSSNYWNTTIIEKYEIYIAKLTKNLYQCLLMLFHNKTILKSLDLSLSQHYYRRTCSTSKKCPRCQAQLSLNVLDSKMNWVSNRFEYDCPVCGLVYNLSKDTPYITIESLNDAIPGSDYKIQLKPCSLKQENLSTVSYIIGEVTNKSTGQTIHQFIKCGNLSEEAMSVDVPLPENLESDLHTIRVILLCDYNISFSRFRFAVCNSFEDIVEGDKYEYSN